MKTGLGVGLGDGLNHRFSKKKPSEERIKRLLEKKKGKKQLLKKNMVP